MLLSMRRGSLGYLKGNGPTDKDYWSSLGMCQEFRINDNPIFEEAEKVPFKVRMVLIWYLIIFSYPTDGLGGILRCDSIGSKSLIRDGEGRMNKALRWLQGFIRLGMILLIWQSSQCVGWRSQTPGAVQRSRCIWSEWAELLRSSSHLFIRTNYLGQTEELVHADLIEVHQRTTVDHDQLRNVTAYSNWG